MNRLYGFIEQIGWKKLLLFGGLIVGVIASGVVYYQRKQPGYTIVKKDKETGETLSIQPNNTPEKTDGQSSATVLGTSSLYKIGAEGLSLSQVALLSNDLGTNAVKSLVDHDSVIKVVEPRYDTDTYTLSATLKYSKKYDPATIIFSLDSVDSFNYKIVSGNKTLYQSAQLIVAGADYTGDGAPPEN